MKRYIALVLVAAALALIAVFPTPAHAIDANTVNSAGFDKLTEAQKAEMLKQIADKVEANKSAPPDTKVVEKTAQWVDLGERIGKMLGGAAREVGIAVNEFVKTPVGMLTAALIVWHFMGGVIVHVVGGIAIMVVGMSILWYILRRSRHIETKYDPEKKDIFGRSVKLTEIRHSLSDDDKAMALLWTAAVAIVSLVTTFTY